MIYTTGAEILIDGSRINPMREGFLEHRAVSEARLDQSLDDVPVYGRDLLMFAEGDLFVGDGPSPDVSSVGGLVNYAQAVTHRLMSTRGYHPGDPSFGVPWNRYIGQSYTNADIVRGQLSADVSEELLKDKRTLQVASIRTEFESPSSIRVTVGVIPVHASASLVEIALNVEGSQ